MSDPVRLRAVFGKYPHTERILNGDLDDPRVDFEFVTVKPVHEAFVPMVRRLEYDVSELAVVTALQAIAYGRPIVVLPAVLSSRFVRKYIIGYRPRGISDPHMLVGERVGVRSYTQTTGMWIRAALASDFDLPPDSIRWITREGAHVAEYPEPAFVEREDTDKALPQQLRDGEIAAAVLGTDLPDDADFAPVIPDAESADRAWYDRHGFMPVTHMVAVSGAAAQAHPAAIRAVYDLLEHSAAETAPPDGTPSQTLFGLEKLVDPLGLIIDEMQRQELLPRPLSVDEVLDPARALLR